MRRTLLAVACVLMIGAGGLAGASVHPQHQKAQLVAADVPGPPVTNPIPILFAPTTTTTTAPPPTTTTTTEPPPPRPVDRPARVRTATPVAPPQTSPQPVDGDLAFPPNCLSGAFWGSFHQTSDKIPYAHQCWDQLLAKYPWNTSTAFSVMMCESEGNPTEVNSSGATGLMQVVTKGASTEPNQNMRQAWAKYTGAGNSWGPWSPSSYCSSRKQKG